MENRSIRNDEKRRYEGETYLIMIRTVLLILLILLLLGALPTWPYSADWGYFPSGGLVVAIVLVVLLVKGDV